MEAQAKALAQAQTEARAQSRKMMMRMATRQMQTSHGSQRQRRQACRESGGALAVPLLQKRARRRAQTHVVAPKWPQSLVPFAKTLQMHQ